MTQRKYRDTTRGGYPVRNIRTRETSLVFVLQAEIGSLSVDPLSGNPTRWRTLTFTENGAYRFNSSESPFDLIEVTE